MADKKYDYESESFSNACENYALKGLTDKEIAIEMGLFPTYFCELKSKYDNISEALARGRSKIISAVRQKYIGVALGGLKRKTVTRKIPSRFDDESDIHPDGMIVLETTEELAPNAQALATLLFNYDEEWRKKVIDGKKLDVTSNGKELNGSINIMSWLQANNEDDGNEGEDNTEDFDNEEEEDN
ncbi:Uncharacterised protein [Sphingobacterium multivorum]|uniref:hypothetical protein n=1 Tax=Sphingobacterium multivorum TaxID=28454 RepID=UPI000DFEB114|nr:hypothetical protein [Sphingobacterium multivorum]QQT43374.1 hypothetical protein I6J00_16650 [Sphingobacterium multivorum]SUI98418.1 Uncharacterised protein [Sphingobacterium multivorum]